jgi:tellurite resistance protein
MLLGVLVEQFGMFVRERYDAPLDVIPLDDPFPDDLTGLHKSFGHHIIPLALLSRTDGTCCEEERKAIVTHCVTLSRQIGPGATEAEEAALAEYVAAFRPSLVQLDPALRRLEREPADHVAAFLAAARAVVEADGIVRPEERKFLDDLACAIAGSQNATGA